MSKGGRSSKRSAFEVVGNANQFYFSWCHIVEEPLNLSVGEGLLGSPVCGESSPLLISCPEKLWGTPGADRLAVEVRLVVFAV